MTATEQAQVAINELRRAYAAGRQSSIWDSIGLGVPVSIFDDLVNTVIGTSNVTADQLKNYEQLGGYIETWAGSEYVAAKASAQWAPWFARGKFYADAVNDTVKIRADASAFTYAANAALSPVDTVLVTPATFYAAKVKAAVAPLLDPANWPIEVKVALGIAAAGVAIWTIANLATISRVVKP